MEQPTNRLLELDRLIEESINKIQEQQIKIYKIKQENDINKAKMLKDHLKQYDIEVDFVRYDGKCISFFMLSENDPDESIKICDMFYDNTMTLSYYSTSTNNRDEYKRLTILGKFGQLFLDKKPQLITYLNYLHLHNRDLKHITQLYYDELNNLNKLKHDKELLEGTQN